MVLNRASKSASMLLPEPISNRRLSSLLIEPMANIPTKGTPSAQIINPPEKSIFSMHLRINNTKLDQKKMAFKTTTDAKIDLL